MFTVKATDQTGHSVYSCHQYRFEKARSIDGFQTLGLLDAADICFKTISIIGPTFVMNAAGKTVDKFEPEYPTPDDRKRFGLGDGTPRETGRIGSGGDMPAGLAPGRNRSN